MRSFVGGARVMLNPFRGSGGVWFSLSMGWNPWLLIFKPFRAWGLETSGIISIETALVSGQINCTGMQITHRLLKH